MCILGQRVLRSTIASDCSDYAYSLKLRSALGIKSLLCKLFSTESVVLPRVHHREVCLKCTFDLETPEFDYNLEDKMHHFTIRIQ